ncbi:triose-phosphate isomerase [Candidatus Woesebacteria bacterium]|nr:MAG: triose-phosphate isomerase [Candidatus Woesebacteria bacterium]
MIFVNYKTYSKGSGLSAVSLTKILEEVSRSEHIKIIPVVQAIDAELVIDSTRLDVWVQHIDPISYGAHTGWTLPEEVVRIGIKGVFLNHSEHKFADWESLVKARARCEEVNLSTLIFAEDTDELVKIINLKPDFVSYEPPELVGNEETSVSEAKPEVIAEASKIAKANSLPLIVGAGIKSKKDVTTALDLGATGIAVASGIVKSEDPMASLMDLVEGFKNSS